MRRAVLVMLVVVGWLGIFGVAPAQAIYVDNGDTVTDMATGLEWQQETAPGITGGKYNWNEAMGYGDDLTLNNKSDWRLPTLEELRTLVKSGAVDPAIDTGFFPETNSDFYWSSTTDADYTNDAWLVHFYFGDDYNYGKTGSYYVRAVRGGLPESLRNLVISRTGSGSVVSSPSGIACGADCSETYHYNNTITLIPTPDPGSTFTGWSGDADCADGVVTITTADVACTAIFGISTQTLTYTAGAHGAISGDSPQTVTYGDSGATVTAVADSGYTFVSWSDGVATASRTDSNVSSDITVTAFFAAEHTYVLSYTAGAGGSVSGTSPQVVNREADGSPVMAAAATGYHFVEWSDHNASNPRTDTNVINHVMVTANFASDSFALTYTAGDHGVISGDTPQTVTSGTDGAAVTAVAETGYRFLRWSDDVTANPRMDSNVTSDITVTAIFGKKFPWEIVLPAMTNGLGAQEETTPAQ